MKAPKSINVYLREGRHATQPWTFTIDRPGSQNKETKSERYARLFTAKRGAKRMLGAWPTIVNGQWVTAAKNNGKDTTVTFYVIRRKKTKSKLASITFDTTTKLK